MSLAGEYKEKYDEWLNINKEQWGQLTQFGVTDGTELELDYTFSAKDESRARSLDNALKANHGYESTVQFLPEGGPGEPSAWVVYGTTPPLASSLDFLNSWIETLIGLGAENECMFETWGAYPPQAKSTLVVGYENKKRSDQFPFSITVHIPGHIEPVDRGERYEDPLNAKLQEANLGEVTGGGSQLDTRFAIQGVDLDVNVADIDAAISFITRILEDCGAPKGSKIFFERDGNDQTVDFGTTDGVVLCLDAKLPEELWNAHAQDVYPMIERLLKDNSVGQIHGCKAFQESTEVYIYGPSGDAIITALDEFRKTFPLCENSIIRKLHA